MKLKPLGDRLIVQAVEEEETTASGIVLPDTANEKPQKGKVLAVGDGAIQEDGSRRPLDVSEGDASGELSGVGRWRLFEQGSVTAVLYEWNVRTTRAWMNLLAPVARPIFAVNHDYVMRNGGHGLAELLGAPLLAID